MPRPVPPPATTHSKIVSCPHMRIRNHNPALPTLRLPFDWQGNPVDGNGRYGNLYHPFNTSFKDVWKWQRGPKPQKAEKKADAWRMPVHRNGDLLHSTQDAVYWLGHACFLICIGGVRFLTDPVFNALPFVKRYTALPVDPAQLRHIDYLLLSHDHRDHCDKKSLQLLAANNPRARVLTALGMEPLIRPWIGNMAVQEAGWYQQYQTEGFTVSFLPARHWCRRGLNDINRRLWGSFMLEMNGRTIYFGADSGYDAHFATIGQLFPNIDVCMIGAGAYKPQWFMSPSHTSPQEAVQAFGDLGAKTLIPMHYGTFDLSDEPMGEPIRLLQQMQQEGQPGIRLLEVGETMYL
jgi:L-ascorbate metabolism protein UlaG (beta-lactamase superfamily)